MTIFLTDNFTGTDGTDMTAHIGDSGSSWLADPYSTPDARPHLQISSNTMGQYDVTTLGGLFGTIWSSVVPAIADYALETVFTGAGSPEVDLYARANIGGSSLLGYDLKMLAGSGSPDFLSIRRYNGAGSYTFLSGSYSGTIRGQVVRWEITGGAHVVKINGTQVLTTTDGTPISETGSIGLTVGSVSANFSPAIDYITAEYLGGIPFWTRFVNSDEIDA